MYERLKERETDRKRERKRIESSKGKEKRECRCAKGKICKSMRERKHVRLYIYIIYKLNYI